MKKVCRNQKDRYLCVTKPNKMKLTNAIKKAEKLSGNKAVKNGHYYFVNYKNHSIQFCANGREEEGVEATGFYTKKNGTEDDLMTDYFAGTFHDNITKCFKFIDYYTQSSCPIS